MWPIKNTGMVADFARLCNSEAVSLICDMLPADASIESVVRVCMESMITMPGFNAFMWRMISVVAVSVRM